MTPDQLFTLAMITAALAALALLTLWSKYERDTIVAEQDSVDGQRLREAAGTRLRLELAIEETRVRRLLEERLQRELDDALNYKRLNAVTPFRQLRVVERGQPTRFEPGDAA